MQEEQYIHSHSLDESLPHGDQKQTMIPKRHKRSRI